MRGEITEILNRAELPKSNLTNEEKKAMKELRKDENIVILPADKGKCIVVMDRTEYIRKMEEKLKDETTYKQIYEDPTYKIRDKLTTQLQTIKEENEITESEYKYLKPKNTQIPRMYGQPKIHKTGYPLREIVDGCGGVTKDMDKYISKIIKRYVGKGEYYVRNSAHFVGMIKDMEVNEDEMLVSYDVTALYPSVPQDEAI